MIIVQQYTSYYLHIMPTALSPSLDFHAYYSDTLMREYWNWHFTLLKNSPLDKFKKIRNALNPRKPCYNKVRALGKFGPLLHFYDCRITGYIVDRQSTFNLNRQIDDYVENINLSCLRHISLVQARQIKLVFGVHGIVSENLMLGRHSWNHKLAAEYKRWAGSRSQHPMTDETRRSLAFDLLVFMFFQNCVWSKTNFKIKNLVSQDQSYYYTFKIIVFLRNLRGNILLSAV